MLHLPLVLASCIILSAFAAEQLHISNPQLLAEKFADGVENKPALFGVPPYGMTISGEILYNASNALGCDPFDFSGHEQDTFMVLIQRGTCTFVRKVQNAQSAGARAVIVMDNVDGSASTLPFMADDGNGGSVFIPSMIITKSAGQSIVQFIDQHVLAVMQWGVPHPHNIVEWKFWTSAHDDNSIELKETFSEVSKSLGTHQHFEPHYFFLKGSDYGCEVVSPDPKAPKPCGSQCTNNGQYCAVDPEHDLKRGVDGQDVVRENLRQMCLFQQVKGKNVEAWWDYVNLFEKHCSDTKETFSESCSYSMMGKVKGVSVSGVKACITSSGGYDSDSPARNTMIEDEITLRRNNSVYSLPSIMINSQFYRGPLACPSPADVNSCGVLANICSGFAVNSGVDACLSNQGCPVGQIRDACGQCLSPGSSDRITDPNKCSENASVVSSGGVSTGSVFLVVILVVSVVAVLFFYLHRRSQANMRRELADIMQQYVPLGADDDHSQKSRMIPSAIDSSTY